jgi:hypothetical protein
LQAFLNYLKIPGDISGVWPIVAVQGGSAEIGRLGSTGGILVGTASKAPLAEVL